MEINYEWYNKRSIDELLILRSDASEELFKLQLNPDIEKIEYWSEVSAICNSLLKSKLNG